MAVWNELVTARVSSQVVSIHPNGFEVDAERAAHEGPPLQLGEVLSHALAIHQVNVPDTDEHLAAVLDRDSTTADPAALVRGTIVRASDGRLGLAAGRGAVVESAGESLTRITAPETGRYVAAWFLPGAGYTRRQT